ncbi:aldehyde dehydrogenase family protein [Sphingobium arseniciresistens]|uniref:aldehyde dehydrogenase family protein n=1 Tax=Sphingobium arseniciresistens TaxID=3030834 RepID=UPI0023B9C603
MGYVEAGKADGAEVVTGGFALDGPGYFIKPTIFADVDASMSIVREEIFGPVLVASRFKSMEDLSALGNASPYGLAAGIFTRDISKAHKAARALRAGNVWINCYGVIDKSMPFGGFKQSGWGREGGPEGFDSFVEHKAVYVGL